MLNDWPMNFGLCDQKLISAGFVWRSLFFLCLVEEDKESFEREKGGDETKEK